MKTNVRNFTAAFVACCMCIGFISCENDDNNPGTVNTNEYDELYQEILENFVETTIIPTYKALAEAAVKMRTTNENLRKDPTTANIKAAADAWMEARIAWELNEAFLFGPVGEHAMNIDGHVDDWPLDINQINEQLSKSEGLTGEQAWRLEGDVIGFHVTEYLLYRDGQPREVSEFITGELDYLTAATDALVWDCVAAYVAWVGEENVSAEIKKVFNENNEVVAHLYEENDYYVEFGKTLKTASGGYRNVLANAVAEIASGAAEIAGEVGETKIMAPYENKKVEEVESWYSWHSIDDYYNNILSIKNAYLGGVDDKTRTDVSLSTYVALVNPSLDTQIKAKIEDCLTKIKAMGTGGYSFYEVVRDQINEEYVDAAADACGELEILFGRLEDIIE